MKGVKGVALHVKTAASAIATFQKQMMNRFEFMAANQSNNIYKLKNIEVPYYELWGKKYQFDEMFELTTDLDPDDRDYNKLLMTYPDGRMPSVISIEEIYNGLEKGEFSNPSLPQIKGYNPYIQKGDIKKSKGIFKPKILLFLVDEMNELMTSDDYKSVDTIKNAMGSIARLGRAAGVHLALAMQRASGGTVSSDLMNNIQQSILLGAFDSGSSTLMFEKDISNMAKPEIKGRAFMQVGKKDIYEVQTYWIEPEKSWVFVEERKDTYENKVYLDQCKLLGKEPDDSGFVTPQKIGELSEPEVEVSLEPKENSVKEEKANDDDWENFDWSSFDDENEESSDEELGSKIEENEEPIDDFDGGDEEAEDLESEDEEVNFEVVDEGPHTETAGTFTDSHTPNNGDSEVKHSLGNIQQSEEIVTIPRKKKTVRRFKISQ